MISHPANTRQTGACCMPVGVSVHYPWALDSCSGFFSGRCRLQQLYVECCAFFRHYFGGFSGCCCQVTAIVRKTGYSGYLRYTEQCESPPSSGSGFFMQGKAVANFTLQSYSTGRYRTQCNYRPKIKNNFFLSPHFLLDPTGSTTLFTFFV